jgi:serine O-acetyltransferase
MVFFISLPVYCGFILSILSLHNFSAAKIGEGILLDHGTGLVIGETAVVGNWVSLMQVN